jgi:hypothetical protein
MTHQLCEPILDNGVRNTNFFNGRLLAAEDLHAQQLAERQHHSQLGRAIGSGVVTGLEVRPAQTSGNVYGVTISSGLAINAGGQPLELPVPVDLALAVPTTSGSPLAGQFSDCSSFIPALATGMGMYVLLMAPATGYLQNAPMSGLGANGAITGCGARYAVEGVTFRLVRFDPASMAGLPQQVLNDIDALMARTNLADVLAAPATDAADLSMLRNRIAHASLGTDQLAALPRDPFAQSGGHSSFREYGALPALRDAPDGMTDDDVALGLVYWTQIGIRFVDMWSVRRRPSPPGYGAPWDPLVSPVRRSEGEAAFMQFQDHLQWLRDDMPNAAAIGATTFFRYLPAAGLLPMAPAPGSPGLFLDLDAFAHGLAVRGPSGDRVFLDGARLEALMQASLAYPPLDLSVHEMLWLYYVVENKFAIDYMTLPVPPAYIAFARGQMPFFGIPREDVNRWDYSTYV